MQSCAMLVLYILHCWFCVHNLHSNYSVCFIQFSLRRFSELIRDIACKWFCTSIWSWVDDSEWNIDEPKETNSLYLHSYLCVCWLRLCQGHTTGRKAWRCFQLSGQQRLKTCSRSAFRSGWQTVYNGSRGDDGLQSPERRSQLCGASVRSRRLKRC